MSGLAADQSGRLAGAVHPDGDNAQCAGVEPGAPAQTGDVAHLTRVVADQQGLRAIDPGVAGLGGQPGAGGPLSRSGSICKVVPRLSSRWAGLRTTSA